MLYIISTPIGNSNDIGIRARGLFEELDVLLCEDTRRTGMLLNVLGVKNKPKLASFYDEVEKEKTGMVLGWLEEGKAVGLVTDGGTPVVSDPGWHLVKMCRQKRIPITAIPGPSAVINALVLSGLPAGRFCFLGFLPKKTGERIRVLEKYREVEGAKVIYESPFRLNKLLVDIERVYGEKTEVSICREMTKKFEEVAIGNLAKIKAEFEGKKVKGEVVIVFV